MVGSPSSLLLSALEWELGCPDHLLSSRPCSLVDDRERDFRRNRGELSDAAAHDVPFVKVSYEVQYVCSRIMLPSTHTHNPSNVIARSVNGDGQTRTLVLVQPRP